MAKSHELTLKIYRAVEKYPSDEVYGLVDDTECRTMNESIIEIKCMLTTLMKTVQKKADSLMLTADS